MEEMIRIIAAALIPMFEEDEPDPNNATWGVLFMSFILAAIAVALLLSD